MDIGLLTLFNVLEDYLEKLPLLFSQCKAPDRPWRGNLDEADSLKDNVVGIFVPTMSVTYKYYFDTMQIYNILKTNISTYPFFFFGHVVFGPSR